MKKMTMTLLAAAAIASVAMAQPLENCGSKVDSTAMMTDMSGSMMQNMEIVRDGESTEIKKAQAAKELYTRIAKRLSEDFDLDTGVYSVGPYAELLQMGKHTQEELDQGLEKLNTKLEVFGRPTWVGKRAQDRFNTAVGKPEAVLLITDGAFGDKLADPLQVFENFYAVNPESCIHLISAAQTDEEKAAFDALVNVNRCAKPADLRQLLTDDQAFEDMVREIYYRDCTKVEQVEIYGVNFAFDKSVLTAESMAILDKALEVLQSRDPQEAVRIVGWTDYMGSDAYNKKLAMRRAQAVADYFVAHGVDESRLTLEARGKSFKYTNSTDAGRWRNRRVDMVFGEDLTSMDAKETPEIIR